MLADSVEAATRSLEQPTPAKIENIISKVFKSKIDDLQLSECPLSLKEIYLIKSTFLYLYKGMQHKRVDYIKEIENLTSQKRRLLNMPIRSTLNFQTQYEPSFDVALYIQKADSI